MASLTFNVLDQKPHLVVQLINGPSECGGVGGDNAEQQQSCQLCIVSQSVSQSVPVQLSKINQFIYLLDVSG